MRIILEKTAIKHLDEIEKGDPKIYENIMEKIMLLTEAEKVPNLDIKMLEGYKGISRLWVGNYRVIFEKVVEEDTIYVIIVAIRSKVYSLISKVLR